MLFSFLSVSPSAQLKLRRRKAQVERVRKRDLRIHAEERIKLCEAAMSTEHFVRGILSDCVEAACAMVADGMILEEEKGKCEEKFTEEVVVSRYIRRFLKHIPRQICKS